MLKGIVCSTHLDLNRQKACLACGWHACPFLREANPPSWRCCPCNHSIVAARGVNGSKEEFTAWWKGRVMELAMLLHQHRNGVAKERVETVSAAAGSLQR